MVNSKKIKGTAFENQLVDYLNNLLKEANFKRIPSSGALGTTFHEPLLTGDVTGTVAGIPQKFKIECKSGYNTLTNKETKSVSVRKEWFDKVREESKGDLSIPLVACKYDNVRSGVKMFIAMDIAEFAYLINYVTDLKRELDLNYEELQDAKRMGRDKKTNK